MNDKQHLNGCDYLMLGFDRELRRSGFAGNSCQIVLELPCPVCPVALQSRLEKLAAHYPILNAFPGGLSTPYWKLGRGALRPLVRFHPFANSLGGADLPSKPRRGEGQSGSTACDPTAPLTTAVSSALAQRIFNEPLAAADGELLRFDLIEGEGEHMTLVFTWAHALMDAPGAELFLALVGQEDLPLPAVPSPAPPPSMGLRERCARAWQNLHQIDRFGRTAPRCLGARHSKAPPMLQYRVERFSPEETQTIRANAVRHCGLLGDGQYHAAAAVLELHRLHQRLGSPSPSYVLPVPVGLRAKGTDEPLFGNQVAMMMFQFMPEQLTSIETAVAACKAQTEQAMRGGLLESSRILGDLFRFLPLPVYMALLKRGLHGEICSLFFGDTGAVKPQLKNFLGAAIDDFAHVAPATPQPGIGVIFYRFRSALRMTLVHSLQVLNETEAAEFAQALRTRLLTP